MFRWHNFRYFRRHYYYYYVCWCSFDDSISDNFIIGFCASLQCFWIFICWIWREKWKIESVCQTKKVKREKYQSFMSWQASVGIYEILKSNTFHVSDSVAQHTRYVVARVLHFRTNIREGPHSCGVLHFFPVILFFLVWYFVRFFTSSRTFSRGFTFQHQSKKEEQQNSDNG